MLSRCEGTRKVAQIWGVFAQMTGREQTKAGAGLPGHEIVYRALRDQILFGELAPGEAVTIQGLTERLDAGMTPVREAIRRLTAEGALEFRGNRRVVVPELDAAGLDELRVARGALEPELALRAVPRVGPGDLAELTAIDAALDRAIARGDVRGYLEQNYRFHARLYALADAPILLALVDGLWLRFGPSLRMVCGRFGTANLPDRHKQTLAAIRDGDARAAAAAIAADATQGMDEIAAALGSADSIDSP